MIPLKTSSNDIPIRAICFYLPQYHPIPENDEWWGKGFTEWTNVTRARPYFKGHYQPHLPADLGFYDLRLPEVREAQSSLARKYGIQGFCYYHYWFNGRRVLERPFNDILAIGKPDFPFCLCWANENWTRAWDGAEREMLLQQKYNEHDDREHIRWLCTVFKDRRYIRVDERPLFLVYRPSLLPDARSTVNVWREEAERSGIGEIFLAAVERFGNDYGISTTAGFDAAVEFAPDWTVPRRLQRQGLGWRLARKLGLTSAAYGNHRIFNYSELVEGMLNRPTPQYLRFPCVTPSWDNSARRRKGATIFVGSTPELYGSWLQKVVEKTKALPPERRFVFINGWNEWAEGNHLEPCQRWGRAYLEATRAALSSL